METVAARSELEQVIRSCRESFLAVAVFSLFVNLLMLVPPLYMLQVYDRVLASGSESTLLMLSLIVVFLFATLGGLEWVRSQVIVRVSVRLDALLGPRLFDASLRQSLLTAGAKSGAQPLYDLAGLRQFLTGPGLFAFFDVPWIPVYVVVMFLFHAWFGWLAVLAIVLLGALTLLNERLTADPLGMANREAIAASAATARNLRNAEVVEAMGMADTLRRKWRSQNDKVIAYQALASERGGVLSAASRTMRLLLQSAVLGVGAWLVLRNEMTAGVMIAGSILLGRALAPIDQLTAVWRGFVAARGQYRRLDETLRSLPPESERMPLPPPTGSVVAEAISVVPPGGQIAVLRGVSLALASGEVLGVIGPSASGKSTLARALLGIWPVSSGRVRLDGADIATLDRAVLGSHLGYLPQDIELFDGSVAENISRFGDVDAAKVVEAAQRANVHEMILRLPQGYDTVIGASGGVLSAGQRQRLALARAIYGTPRIVVLDEPNSNLDEQGDLALRDVVRQLKALGTTVVIVSHRAGILDLTDKLIALSEGQVVAFGPRDQVLAKVQAPPPVRAVPAAGALSTIAGLPARST